MTKLLVFDIDGTICDINKEINENLLNTLRKISENHQIVLSSGKPFGYIAGFARQLAIKDLIIIGENGGTIMYDQSFPPKKYYKVDIKQEVVDLFQKIKNQYIDEFKETIWFQPNEVNLTVFPLNIHNINSIHNLAKKIKSDKITIYYHKDSVDFVQKGFDKGTAIDVLLSELGVSKENLYVFGDGSNDIPMLNKTKNSISINNKDLNCGRNLKNYKELSNYLKNNFL